MKNIKKLKEITTFDGFASYLDYDAKDFYCIIKNKNFTSFKLKKKNGKTREINAPSDERYKELLRRLNKKLSNILDEKLYFNVNTESKTFYSVSHGFIKDHSIMTNARKHTEKRYVFNIDLKDFFPSIHYGRVKGFFIKDKDLQLNEDIATLLARLLCHKGSLPQGSPCSPTMSNLIANILDKKLLNLARKYGCTYTRYADDITFSTNKKEFPIEIAENNSGDWQEGVELTTAINNSGFEINPNKTRMSHKTSNQSVTGIVVNKKVNIRKKNLKQMRAVYDSLIKTGKSYHPYKKSDDGENIDISLNQINGILSQMYLVQKTGFEYSNENKKRKIKLSSEKLYQKFLYYRMFLNPEQPTIICEGKLDGRYIKSFIMKMKSIPDESKIDIYNSLIEPKTQKSNIHILNQESEITTELLKLGGGSEFLNSFISNYNKSTKFKNAKNPLIVFYDFDEGADEVCNIIKDKLDLEKKYDIAPPFFKYIQDNLYVAFTPKKDSCIESFIETEEDTITKKNKEIKINLNGKEISKNDYSKYIMDNWSKLNYEKFEPILNIFHKIIVDYQKRVEER